MSEKLNHNQPPELMCCIYCGTKSRESRMWYFKSGSSLPVCKEHYDKLHERKSAQDAVVSSILFGDD